MNTKELFNIYKSKLYKIREVRDSTLIIEDTFIVKNIDSLNSVDDEFIIILEELLTLGMSENINQYIVISENGFDLDKDSYKWFNIRFEGKGYINQLLNVNFTKEMELMAHNRNAVNYIVERFEEGENRCCVVQPTGSGKSYVLASLFKKYDNENKIVLVPNVYIKNQLEATFRKFNMIRSNYKIITYSRLIHMSSNEIDNLAVTMIALDEFHRAGSNVWGLLNSLFKPN